MLSLDRNEQQIVESLPATGREANPEKLALNLEQVRLIVERIKQIKVTKRGEYYKAILYGTFFLGLEDEEMAFKYSLSLLEIQKMRSHALNILRKDRAWLASIR